MRKQSQTLIGSLRNYINIWRTREGWSRESVAQHIADEYKKTDGETVIGIKFEPNTTDFFERAHVNAERIFRWLDDETKSTNLIPPNFIPYIVAIMPLDLRIAWANEQLQRSGLATHVVGSSVIEQMVDVFQRLAKESGEAVASMAKLVAGKMTADEIADAKSQLTEAKAALETALKVVESVEAAP